jgi:EmrB/QacA subfamily drug resistance transporter
VIHNRSRADEEDTTMTATPTAFSADSGREGPNRPDRSQPPPPGTGPALPRAGASSQRRWLTLAVLSLSLLLIVIDTTIVNIAIPTLATALHASPSELEWVVDAYTLAFAALLLPAGNLGDRYGRHRALAAGLAIFGAASLGAALARTAPELIAWRAVMGAGAALVMPATMAVLTSVFTDPAERARAIGIWSAVSGLGVAIGPTAGGWLLSHYSWGAIFLVNLPVVAIALIGGVFLVPPSAAPSRPRFDPAGIVLAVAGFGVLTFTLIDASSAGWSSVTTLSRGAASAVLLAGFLAWEIRTDHPMVDLELFRNPRFSAAAAAIALVFFGLGGAAFLLTQVYQFVLGYSPLGAGVRMLPAAAALSAAAPLAARLSARLGTRAVVTGGLLTAAAGLGYLALATGRSGYPHYLIGSALMSAGIGMTMSPATQSVMAVLPAARTGTGSAVNSTTRNLGTVLGVAIVGSIAATAYARAMRSLPGAPAAVRRSVAVAAEFARRLAAGHRGETARLLHEHAAQAFVHGTALGSLTAAGAVLAGAAATTRFLPARARRRPVPLA